mgnify:CR=1 FL=1
MSGSNEVDRSLIVGGHERIADDVWLITLRDPSGSQLPEWEAGAHIDVVLGSDLIRQYSLCSSPANRDEYQIAVLREAEGRGGSRAICDTLAVGDAVTIRGPRNHFPLAQANHYLFVAGGIGVTPMLPMIEQAEAAGADWSLVYGGHTRTAMAFADDLVAEYGERVTLLPRDAVDASLSKRLPAMLEHPRGGQLVYTCGPESLLESGESLMVHWAKGSLHLERFSPKVVEGENHGFDLVLQRSGKTLFVPPERSIVEVVQDVGIMVLTSCKDGVCGTCETIVLEGEIDHRDSVFNAEERETADSMMVCVSRCKGDRLVLDL